jgi:hypothetical protein
MSFVSRELQALHRGHGSTSVPLRLEVGPAGLQQTSGLRKVDQLQLLKNLIEK